MLTPSWMKRIGRSFRRPDLHGNASRTYRLHLAYAVLDGVAGGILLNAPLVAIKAFEAADWHLPLRELYSGLGMIGALYLGSWMAPRRKMPFVFIPGIVAGISALFMATATTSAFAFLTLLGVGAMFEIVSRPAITAILRLNYPAEHRGHATGQVRKWSSLAFVASSLTSAFILEVAAAHGDRAPAETLAGLTDHVLLWPSTHMPQVLMIVAGLISLLSFVCFRRIRVDEEPERQRRDLKPEIAANFRDAFRVVVRDRRYRRYLFACFLDGFSQMLYFPLLWAFFSRDLGFDYVGCSALMHAVPALMAFAVTGALGRLFDRLNPWVSWAGIRFVWGFDALLLAATPFCASLYPPLLFVLPLIGRVLRGSVQGGWWILWWQIGVTHFAPPGEDTSRYMGIVTSLNGAIRLLASGVGMTLAYWAISPGTLILIGGIGVILSGCYSMWQAHCERREHVPETMAEFENQFLTGTKKTD